MMGGATWASLVLFLSACSAAPGWGQQEWFVRNAGEPAVAPGPAKEDSAEPPPRRAQLSAGMGVSYVNPPDVVDLVNTVPGNPGRTSQFKTAVEFFGDVAIPVGGAWTLKVEYAYLLGSYNIDSGVGPAEITFVAHMPTLLLQYTLVHERTYDVRAGVGVGYHFGTLSEKYGSLDDSFTGKGLGFTADVEANTALGEDLFVYLGGNIRWDFIGALSNGAGRPPSVTASAPPTLTFFGIGARLGLSYFF